jgi:hypothetical protein
MKNESKSKGLVICSISVRNGINSEPPLSIQTKRVAALFEKPKELSVQIFEEKVFLSINPGMLKISRKKPKTNARVLGAPKRKSIKRWTAKSRSNMVSRFSSLDYSEMFEKPNPIPVMITLTYPGDWLVVAPTASASKAHLIRFKKRFEREYKLKFRALWKAEFQRRGAVHFHIFCVSPIALSEFRQWVARTWADVVNHPDPQQKQNHLRAGTAVDYAVGSTKDTPKRTAIYFSKHSSPNVGKKEYQNHPPAEWVEHGSVGRFWGYWNLTSKAESVELLKADAVYAARIIRRWHRAQGITRKERAVRISDKTGHVSFRWQKRRVKRFNGVSGFLATDSGLQVAECLARAIRIKSQDSGV